jgi:hypothetical protein
MLYTYKKSLRRSVLCSLLLLLTACYSPVFNQHIASYQNSIRWQGEPMQKLILYKGKPNKIYFIGNTNKSLVSSEYWTPEIDRYETLYKQYGSVSGIGHRADAVSQIYKKSNESGHWLLVYSTPILGYQSGLHQCTEYFQINSSTTIVKAGFLTNSRGAHKYCGSIRE